MKGVTDFPSERYLAPVGLIVLGILTYWQGATSPALFGDEWGRVSEIAFGRVACPTYSNLFMRPLVGCYIAALHAVFGHSFATYHTVSLVWVILSAILLYLILNKIIPHNKIVSTAAAALFLVYPANYARLFFERGSYEISLVLFLWGALVWLDWYRSLTIGPFLLTIGLLAVSLLLYEAQLGLLLLVSILFFIATPKKTLLRSRLSNFSPALLGVLFMVGRSLTQLAQNNVHGHTNETITLSVSVLVLRLYLGLRTIFQWAWTSQIAQLAPYRIRPEFSMVLFLVMAFVLLLVAWRGGGRNRGHLETNRQLEYQRTLLLLAVVGTLVAMTGYFPGILASSPGLEFLTSRFNIVPSIGAAITLSVVLFFCAHWLSSSALKRKIVYVGLLLPLFFMSVNAQVRAQQCTAVSWERQKSMWRQLTVMAPSLAAHSNIVLLVNQDPENCVGGAALLESGPWGVGSALSVLYGQDGLKGWFAYVSPGTPPLIYEPTWWQRIPESDRIIFLYDQATDTLTQLAASSTLLPSTCGDCIQTEMPDNTGWRWLIR